MRNWWRRLVGLTADAKPASASGSASADYTRPATWANVMTTVRLLNAAGVRYVLVGGYALAAHGYVRMTEDVDIAVAPVSVLDLAGLLKTKQGVRPKDQADAAVVREALARGRQGPVTPG